MKKREMCEAAIDGVIDLGGTFTIADVRAAIEAAGHKVKNQKSLSSMIWGKLKERIEAGTVRKLGRGTYEPIKSPSNTNPHIEKSDYLKTMANNGAQEFVPVDGEQTLMLINGPCTVADLLREPQSTQGVDPFEGQTFTVEQAHRLIDSISQRTRGQFGDGPHTGQPRARQDGFVSFVNLTMITDPVVRELAERVATRAYELGMKRLSDQGEAMRASASPILTRIIDKDKAAKEAERAQLIDEVNHFEAKCARLEAVLEEQVKAQVAAGKSAVVSNIPTPDEIFPIDKAGKPVIDLTIESQDQLNERIEVDVFAALRGGQTRFEVTMGEFGSMARMKHTIAHQSVIEKLRAAGFVVTKSYHGSGWSYTISR